MSLRLMMMCYGVLHMGVMMGVTVWASFEKSILETGPLFSFPWFMATLVDTYLGFFLFLLWVIYLQRSMLSTAIWFVLVFCLGNIAMGYFLFYRAYSLDDAMTMRTFLSQRRS